MYQLKRILVCLDLSETDEALIKYASLLSNVVGSESVYFLHVARSLELPKELTSKYPDLVAPVDESLEHDIKVKVNQHFSGNATVNIDVDEGNPGECVMKWLKRKEVDLILVGRKSSRENSGRLIRKLAQLAPCSIITVPDTLPQGIRKVVVPVDFSETSKMAFDQAVAIQEKTNCAVVVQHVYEVPSGFHKTGKSFEEFSEIMKGHAANSMKSFLGESMSASNLSINYTLNDNNLSSVDEIYKFAKKEQTDLLIVGSKGRTKVASLLLGSISEKLTDHVKTLPLMIVKDKNEGMGILGALLNL